MLVSTAALFFWETDVYYVQSGDSLWSIAKKFEVTIRDLSIWNDLNPSNFLLTGSKILIYPKYLKPRPVPKVNRNDIAYPVKTGDTINKISLRFGITKDWILKWNDIEDESLIYPGDILNLNLSELIDRKLFRFMGETAAYSFLSAQEAIEDSGISEESRIPLWFRYSDSGKIY